MKIRSIFIIILGISGLTSLCFNCKKDTIKTIPIVLVSTVNNITSSTALSGGEVTSNGGTIIIASGVCYSTSQNPTVSDIKITSGNGIGSFTSLISGLLPGTTYYLKAFATNSIGTGYSDQVIFTTTALAPILVTSDLSAISSTSAATGGNIANDGGSAVTARGVCWGINQNPAITDTKTTDGTGSGTFASVITGLNPGATYYIRAYATNNIGTSYGNQVILKTHSVLPQLTTMIISNITAKSALSGGSIMSDGGSLISSKGVCWSTSLNPSILDNKTFDGDGSGSFSSNLSTLNPGSIYHVRAYAINNIGVAYGNDIQFITLSTFASLVTTAITNISFTSFSSGGNITNDGGASVIAKGVCWSFNSNPTINDTKTTDGLGIGNYSSNLIGLNPGTTYYIRAYATNSVGTTYGNELTGTTSANLPVITTNQVTSILTTSATSGGYITNSGGTLITARGVCWSTNNNPTITDSKTIDGAGVGSFTSNIINLAVNTKYYLRSYAINANSTVYGDEISFTTLPLSGNTIKDIDGNVYHSVTIGTQVWLVENLRTTKYSNGDVIGTTIPATLDITSQDSPKYQWAYDGNENNVTTFGRLYTRSAAQDSRNLAPTGWHVAKDSDWNTLTIFLGDFSSTGGKLKEVGFVNWASPNLGATNEVGFNALPGGSRNYIGQFNDVGYIGYWWTGKDNWYWSIGTGGSYIYRNSIYQYVGFSVRCVKD